ncbi:MAG: hypothetical protein WCJ56_06010 [bacterium]
MKKILFTVLAFLVFNGLLVCSAMFSLNNLLGDYFLVIFYAIIPLVGIIFQLYLLLVVVHILPTPQRIWTMPWQKKLAISCIIVVLLAGIGYGRWVDFFSVNFQPPPILPPSVVLSGIKHNRSYRTDGWLAKYLWRAKVTPQAMAALCKQYNLEPSTSAGPVEFYNQRPYWWHPVITPNTKIYWGGNSQNQRFVAIWDSQTQIMYATVEYVHGVGIFL